MEIQEKDTGVTNYCFFLYWIVSWTILFLIWYSCRTKRVRQKRCLITTASSFILQCMLRKIDKPMSTSFSHVYFNLARYRMDCLSTLGLIRWLDYALIHWKHWLAGHGFCLGLSCLLCWFGLEFESNESDSTVGLIHNRSTISQMCRLLSSHSMSEQNVSAFCLFPLQSLPLEFQPVPIFLSATNSGFVSNAGWPALEGATFHRFLVLSEDSGNVMSMCLLGLQQNASATITWHSISFPMYIYGL